jgi:hypothetical protein
MPATAARSFGLGSGTAFASGTANFRLVFFICLRKLVSWIYMARPKGTRIGRLATDPMERDKARTISVARAP